MLSIRVGVLINMLHPRRAHTRINCSKEVGMQQPKEVAKKVQQTYSAHQ